MARPYLEFVEFIGSFGSLKATGPMAIPYLEITRKVELMGLFGSLKAVGLLARPYLEIRGIGSCRK
jgi:hypothetical protein